MMIRLSRVNDPRRTYGRNTIYEMPSPEMLLNLLFGDQLVKIYTTLVTSVSNPGNEKI